MQGSVRYTVFESSGALRVENPEELRDLAALEIRPSKSGYLHVYIANTSARAVNWDELAITRLRGQVLEINHYYPYGLQLFGIDNEGRSYPYKYGSKELQQDEWARRMVMTHGFVNLDWLDFEARMYACPEQTVRRPCGCRRDPAIARWYNPDPAEQFMNPYLAMGNNPVMYIDPNGEVAWFVPIIVGAALSTTMNGIENIHNGDHFLKGAGRAAIIGAWGGAVSFGIGQLTLAADPFVKGMAHGALGAVQTEIQGGNAGIGFFTGFISSSIAIGVDNVATEAGVCSRFARSAIIIGTGTLSGGVTSLVSGGTFWDGARNGAISSGLNHALHFSQSIIELLGSTSPFEETGYTLQHKPIGGSGEEISSEPPIFDPKKLRKLGDGSYQDPVTLDHFDASGKYTHTGPSLGTISPDYSMESILIPSSKVKTVISLVTKNNWLRVKPSWNPNKQGKYMGVQWGAAEKHAKHIRPMWLQNFNRMIRRWGEGHWHWWRLPNQ